MRRKWLSASKTKFLKIANLISYLKIFKVDS